MPIHMQTVSWKASHQPWSNADYDQTNKPTGREILTRSAPSESAKLHSWKSSSICCVPPQILVMRVIAGLIVSGQR
jgi:hypothetical protein